VFVAHCGEERKILKQQNILCNNKLYFFVVNEVFSRAFTKTPIFIHAFGTPTRIID
jgi:hypothetical protein